jgi:putative FmdB family regulatory protein
VPIYDYICSACGHLTEVIHGIDDPGPRFCPNCGAEATMTKTFSAPTVHFKGSGWAKKDRASSARQTAKPADEAAPATSEATSEKEPSGSSAGGSGAPEKSTAAGDKQSSGSADSSGSTD